MGLREADTVVAICDISCCVTARQVARGSRGLVLKQSGWRPVTFKVRFSVATTSVTLDGVTDHQIERVGGSLGGPFEGLPKSPDKRATASDPS